MKTNEERLQDLFSYLGNLSHVKADEIPDIDLYMDQVTTFMDSHLKDMRRHPGDKVLTKTMINNYAKNNLLPPPVKKKYSKDHMLMLVFIYYFKNLLSFNDSIASSSPFFAASNRLSLFREATLAFSICMAVFLIGRRIFPWTDSADRLADSTLTGELVFWVLSLYSIGLRR